MKNELKRALLNKRNFLILVLIVFLMFANAYYSGWNTSLGVYRSDDIDNMNDKKYIAQYFGNTYRVWFSSFSTVSIFAPVLLVVPYIFSYREEIDNNFRYMMISRESKFKYSVQKILSIALSGTFLLMISEILFYLLSYRFTYHIISMEFLEGIVSYKTHLFMSAPFKYFVIIIILRALYYFSLAIFSVGITSFIETKIAILIVPFLVITIFDTLLPQRFAPFVMIRPNGYEEFNILIYFVFISALFSIGIITYFIHEKKLSITE